MTGIVFLVGIVIGFYSSMYAWDYPKDHPGELIGDAAFA
jgi:hypothetical protein